MADRVLRVVDNQVRASVAGGPLVAALAAQAALPFTERAETAQIAAEAVLAEIAAIELAGSTAPAIAGKADKSVVGINIATIGTEGDPAFDNTAAVDAAAPGAGGGVVQFPLGDWYLNAAITDSNIHLRGQLGEGENLTGGENALRPFDTDLPTVQFGDGIGGIIHNNSVRDLLISGYNPDTGLQAPAALSLLGGVGHFYGNNFELIGGVRTLELVPEASQPVFACYFSDVHIRQGSSTDANARAVYLGRYADANEFLTAFGMVNGHINGPTATDSYTVEIDGGPTGITASFVNMYCDMHDGRGFLIKGPSLVLGFNLQMDPHANNVVIYETDQTSLDPTDALSGNIRHGGQFGKNVNGDTVAIPADVEWFFRHPAITNPRLGGQLFINTDPANRFSTSVYLTAVSANGQVGLYGTGLDIRDTTDATTLTAAFQVRGGARFEKKVRISTDLFVGGVLNIGGAQFQDSLGTGVRVDAPGTIRLLGGATAVANQLIPDGAATLGSSSDPWPNSNLSKIFLGSSTEPTINKGTGTPEGVVTAPIGSTYHRKDGGAGTSFYVKESGAGNTGWVGK